MLRIDSRCTKFRLLTALFSALLCMACGGGQGGGTTEQGVGGIASNGGNRAASGGNGVIATGGTVSVGTAGGSPNGGAPATGGSTNAIGGATTAGGVTSQGGAASGGAQGGSATGTTNQGGATTGGMSTSSGTNSGGSFGSIAGGKAFMGGATGGGVTVTGGSAQAGAFTGGTTALGGGSTAGGAASVPTGANRIIYVATTGNDTTGMGTFDNPYATASKATTLAQAGTLIYLRGGTYLKHPPVSLKTVSGTATAPIYLWAYPGETPILDFAENGTTARGVSITMSYWHIKGLIIQYAAQHGITVSGSSHVTIENCTTRNNNNMGLSVADGASYTTILNCDSYDNYDRETNGENADGFGAKYNLGPGNLFKGCRAWSNADDGWDLWGATAPVRIEDCWAYRNGKNVINDTAYSGDGNGFKLGTTTDVNAKHVLVRSMSWDNLLGNGFEDNKNSAGVTYYNCVGYRNKKANFEATDAGPHVAKNNVSLLPTSPDNIAAQVESSNNTWNGLSVTTADFLSLDDSVAVGSRAADGSLPVSNFLHLAPSSALIDAGTDVGLPFLGAKPDLGAYETR